MEIADPPDYQQMIWPKIKGVGYEVVEDGVAGVGLAAFVFLTRV